MTRLNLSLVTMINPEDSVVIDLRTSIPEEEAVAKLLGWMQGTRRIANLLITEDGIDPAQFALIHRLPQPLETLISEEREFASIRFHNAAAEGNLDGAEKWEARVKYWDDIASRSARYLSAIHQELGQRNSKLVVDEEATAATRIRHITLNSLDRWARMTLGTDIQRFEETSTDIKAHPSRSLAQQREALILETIRQLGYDPAALPPRLPGKSGACAQVRKTLASLPLFAAKKSFEKAWQALRTNREITGG